MSAIEKWLARFLYAVACLHAAANLLTIAGKSASIIAMALNIGSGVMFFVLAGAVLARGVR